MRIFLAVILLLIINISYSQTIEELEYELSYYKSGENWSKRRKKAYKLLKIDSLNRKAINYLIKVYGSNGQKDSIKVLFNKVIKDNPSSILYIIRTSKRNAHFAELTYFQQINFLKEEYKLDRINEVIYMLGKLYYGLFIKEYNDQKKEVILDHYSKNSIKYFSIVWGQKESYIDYKGMLKYPLIQLANYQNDKSKLKLYENYNLQSSYFPISAFVNLPNDWQTNYSVDVLEGRVNTKEKKSFKELLKYTGVESAISHINGYSKYLLNLNEPILIDSLPGNIFRFTWLRSFHNPIVIGLENHNDLIIVYWKVCGAGGKIIEDKSKELTIKEWSDIVSNINSIEFWNLPSIKRDIIGCDGAEWILEGKELGKYHVVDRWSGREIKKVCRQLLELTDLKIEHIY